ncbi:MAG: hypothetical protein LUP99_04000, partial [Methanomicrobiales archaeon]|nr:hypothetical protein [Methanomicrobiales archaeon]
MKTLPKKDEKNWSKIGIIILGIGFALLFIGTYILSILTGTVFAEAVKPGDSVTIGLTLRDAQGRAVLTTDQQIYASGRSAGDPVFFSPSIALVANKTYNESLVALDAYVGTEWIKFGMFGAEMEMISAGIVGMKTGETKTIHLDSLTASTRTMTKEEYEGIGGNFTTSVPGEMLIRAFSEQPEIPVDGVDPMTGYRWRTIEVVEK